MPAAAAAQDSPPTLADAVDNIGTVLADAVAMLRALQEATADAVSAMPATHNVRALMQAVAAAKAVAAAADRMNGTALMVWGAGLIGVAADVASAALHVITELHQHAIGAPRPNAPAVPVLVAPDGAPVTAATASALVDVAGRPLFSETPAAAAEPDEAPPLSPPFDVPTCTTCGCTDARACRTATGPCGWARLDNTTNAGTCTACAE